MPKTKNNASEENGDDDVIIVGESSVSDAHFRLSKHRSCWVHVVASLYAMGVKISKQEAEDLWSFEKTSPCYLGDFPTGKRSDRRIKKKNSVTVAEVAEQATRVAKEKLDSGTFDCYVQKIWKNLSEDKRTSFICLDSIYFALYMKKSFRGKVLSWIKKKNIFSKEYVLIPIVCQSHWNLLILCHLGESLFSETRKPCIFLLDSLEIANPSRFEPDIRKFVLDIYRSEGRAEDEKKIYKIPLLVPKVPQQRNETECGNYVLYYINLFIKDLPNHFSIEDYHYFMNENWFKPESLEQFFETLGPVENNF